MTHVSLFTGIGGFDLAAEWAGFRTVLQVERDLYCRLVLARHWPGVRRITDIHEVTSESVSEPVTVISGGFPCQPFSAAGKRGGTEDDRYLWPAMLGVIRALTPRWVVAENVPGLLSLNGGMVFETVLSDLEREGYETQPVVVPAAGVGAPHLRQRVFIVGYAHQNSQPDGAINAEVAELSSDVAHTERHGRRPRRAERQGQHRRTASIGASGSMADAERIGRDGWWSQTRHGEAGQSRQEQSAGCCAYVADASGERRQQDTGSASRYEATDGRQSNGDHVATGHGEIRGAEHWFIEPGVRRVANGIPRRVDRLRALGNAVVPQQAYPIFAAIREAMT